MGQVAGQRRQRQEDLPSSCPDLASPVPLMQFGGHNGVAAGYHASLKEHFRHDGQIRVSDSDEIVELQGYMLSEVAEKIDGFQAPAPLDKEGAVYTPAL